MMPCLEFKNIMKQKGFEDSESGGQEWRGIEVFLLVASGVSF
jgi:hypothetical protein